MLASDGLDDLDDYYQQSLPATVAAAVVPLLVGIRILGTDWLSALIIVLTVPLIPFFMVLIGKHTEERTQHALSAISRMADHLAELAHGLPVLVGLRRVEQQAQALGTLQTSYRKRTQETLRWAFLSALALELIATISVAIVAVFLGLRFLNGNHAARAGPAGADPRPRGLRRTPSGRHGLPRLTRRPGRARADPADRRRAAAA